MNYFHDMNLPDINDLAILKNLLRDPHLTRCAAKLNLTQSAISHTLNRLRHRFSDPLFVRSKQGLEATPFLLSLEPLIDSVIKTAEDIQLHSLAFDPSQSRRSFTIGMPELVSIPFIPKLLKQIREIAPHIVLNFMATSPQDAVKLIEDKKLDLYAGAIKELSGNLKAQTLYKENFVCLARKEYKIFKNDKISKVDYLNAKHLKLSLQGNQPSYIDQTLSSFGVSRQDFVTLPFYLLGFEVMQHENLLMTAPQVMVHHILNEFSMQKSYKVVPFPYPIDSLPISQYWHIRSDKDASHTWLRQVMKATAKSMDVK